MTGEWRGELGDFEGAIEDFRAAIVANQSQPTPSVTKGLELRGLIESQNRLRGYYTDSAVGVRRIVEELETLGFDRGMTVTAVGVEQDGSGVVEDGDIGGPSVGNDGGVDAGDLVEAFGEEQAACAEFVVASTMAGTAGAEDDLLVGGEAQGGMEADNDGEDACEMAEHEWSLVDGEGRVQGRRRAIAHTARPSPASPAQ